MVTNKYTTTLLWAILYLATLTCCDRVYFYTHTTTLLWAILYLTTFRDHVYFSTWSPISIPQLYYGLFCT